MSRGKSEAQRLSLVTFIPTLATASSSALSMHSSNGSYKSDSLVFAFIENFMKLRENGVRETFQDRTHVSNSETCILIKLPCCHSIGNDRKGSEVNKMDGTGERMICQHQEFRSDHHLSSLLHLYLFAK